MEQVNPHENTPELVRRAQDTFERLAAFQRGRQQAAGDRLRRAEARKVARKAAVKMERAARRVRAKTLEVRGLVRRAIPAATRGQVCAIAKAYVADQALALPDFLKQQTGV